MTLAELFKALSVGELSNLSLSGEGGGTITAAAQTKVVRYANDGLLKLHARFILKEDDILLELLDEITNYKLLRRFATSYVPQGPADDEPVRYILDRPELPFLGDVLRVLTVYDSNGNRLPLNDENQPYSVFTPQANVLNVPLPATGDCLSVLYQARHPELTGEPTQEIVLPDVLVEALTAYVAYKTYSHMNTQESTAKAQEHLGLYESLCREAEDKDLVNTSIVTTQPRFSRNGWV